MACAVGEFVIRPTFLILLVQPKFSLTDGARIRGAFETVGGASDAACPIPIITRKADGKPTTVRDEGVADLGGENAFDKEIFDQDRCWVEHRTVRRVKIFLKRTVAWQTDVVGEEESLHAANWNTVEGEHLDVQRRLLRCFNTGAVKSE